MSDETEPTELSRRALIVGAGATAAAVGGAIGFRAVAGEQTPATGVPALGAQQAGVTRPAMPQQHCLVVVADLDTTALRTTLGALGTQIALMTDPSRGLADLTPDGPGDLTVTVGIGPGALGASGHSELATLLELPEFAGDAALPADRRGGELLLGVNASDPTILEPVASWLMEQVGGARMRWSEFGYRGTPVEGVGRNPFGYFDGIIVPRSEQELRDDVMIAEGPLAGGTICVMRRFRLDVEGFRRLSPAERDATVGREQATGAPLSGGARDDQVDLDAKTPDGALLVPARAHARAAHPSFTGSALMLRRSYSYRASDDDHGHLFISYQNDVQTFARTQLRLDETDALMAFATPTATAAFAILPGMRDGSDLGASLF
ncbi:Dyp-type peroxidase [Protaetiibacter intestinalis]|uniref:Dyp-type peroxidase n=1 Tax=Protaetiibacter intestinalis TaxID=2419774 RepID=A0A387B9F8_9MICO|nr:Dyp-type peroxidase [Protaetiibacter intestinalis]AYF97569.1 Dyp-type peroxidase [Protaetiibacter intestinalis]